MINQPERTLADVRSDLELLNGAVAQLERDLAVATQAEDQYHGEHRAVTDRLNELCRSYGLRVVEDRVSYGGVSVVGEAPRGISQEVLQLVARRRELESQRDRWIADHTVKAATADGMPVTKTLTTHDVGRRLKICREARDRVATELAEREAALSAGELALSGKPADEYVDHRSRLAAMRERFG